MMEDLVILGSGCAGLTAALYAARSQCRPLVVEGPLPGGQLTQTTEIENYPGFPEGIPGYELMERMRRQAERFGARFVREEAEKVTREEDSIHIYGTENEWQTRALIVATGNTPRRLGIPGENELYGGKGVSSCATCDGLFYRGQEVCVVGGGDTACEEALFLTRFCPKIFVLHRRDTFKASPIMVTRIETHPKIHILRSVRVERFVAGHDGYLRAVQFRDAQGESSELPCRGAFLAIGHVPNTQFLGELVPLDESGYITPSSAMSASGIFAAGDCVDKRYRQAIVATGSGCQAALEAERWLASRRPKD
jgi:thioredoxin reductase (NADPH)